MSNASLQYAITFLADGVSSNIALNVLESPFSVNPGGAVVAPVFGGRLNIPSSMTVDGITGIPGTTTATVDPGGNVEFVFPFVPTAGFYRITGSFVF